MLLVAKKLHVGCWLQIKSRWLKEGVKHLVLSAEVPVVLLPSDGWLKIRLAIAVFSADEFCRQLAITLSGVDDFMVDFVKIGVLALSSAEAEK